MFYTLKAYFNFLRKSTNQHGVHSPFVYQFVTRCLYDRKKHSAYSLLKNYRSSLLNSGESIEVTDFGAGSRVFRSNKRAVKDIASYAGASLKRMKLLYRVVAYFRPEQRLELGTSLGLGTAALALSNNGKVISLEGCNQTAGIAKKYLTENEISNVAIEVGDFKETIFQQSKRQFDLIYFDGNHSKEATLDYFDKLLPTATNDSVWIFDDIYWSAQMTEAWERIKNHPEVRVTVDCFWLGFVFFRKEQVEEHFNIRV